MVALLVLEIHVGDYVEEPLLSVESSLDVAPTSVVSTTSDIGYENTLCLTAGRGSAGCGFVET